jgi:hypothetical protein
MMTRFLIIFFVFAGSLKATAQQGKYAGSFKKLIGTSFTDSRQLPALKNWQPREGTLASSIDDPELFSVEIFQKGTTYMIFFSVKEDTASDVQVIQDVVELKAVQPGWDVRSGVCREYKQANTFVVALVKSANAAYSTNVKKAWRFNRDKRRFEAIAVKTVDCLNEGFEQQ